jgi:hypothetical protein
MRDMIGMCRHECMRTGSVPMVGMVAGKEDQSQQSLYSMLAMCVDMVPSCCQTVLTHLALFHQGSSCSCLSRGLLNDALHLLHWHVRFADVQA